MGECLLSLQLPLSDPEKDQAVENEWIWKCVCVCLFVCVVATVCMADVDGGLIAAA